MRGAVGMPRNVIKNLLDELQRHSLVLVPASFEHGHGIAMFSAIQESDTCLGKADIRSAG